MTRTPPTGPATTILQFNPLPGPARGTSHVLKLRRLPPWHSSARRDRFGPATITMIEHRDRGSFRVTVITVTSRKAFKLKPPGLSARIFYKLCNAQDVQPGRGVLRGPGHTGNKMPVNGRRGRPEAEIRVT